LQKSCFNVDILELEQAGWAVPSSLAIFATMVLQSNGAAGRDTWQLGSVNNFDAIGVQDGVQGSGLNYQLFS